MTRQLFLEIVSHKLYGTLFIIILSFFICWWTLFKLSYLLLGVKVTVKQMAPALFVMVAFSLFMKQFLHAAIFSITMPLLMAFLLWIITKGIHYLKAGWVALSSIIFSNVSSISMASLLCAINPRINHFLLQTPLGLIAGTWLETFFTSLAIFILSRIKLKTSLVPPVSEKPGRLDFMAIFIYLSIFATNYLAAFMVYISLINHYRFIPMALAVFWSTAIVTIIGYYRQVKTMTQTFEAEKFELITEKERLEEEKRQIEIDRNRVAAEKAKLEMEKDRIEKEKNQLQIDKANLLAEKNQLEEEKIGLINEIQELSNQDGFKSPKINQIVKEFVLRVLNLEHSEDDRSNDPLTDRELSVLNLVKDGMDNKEIAAALDLDPGTIKNITHVLFKKVNVKNRTQLALYASNLFSQNKK